MLLPMVLNGFRERSQLANEVCFPPPGKGMVPSAMSPRGNMKVEQTHSVKGASLIREDSKVVLNRTD